MRLMCWLDSYQIALAEQDKRIAGSGLWFFIYQFPCATKGFLFLTQKGEGRYGGIGKEEVDKNSWD